MKIITHSKKALLLTVSALLVNNSLQAEAQKQTESFEIAYTDLSEDHLGEIINELLIELENGNIPNVAGPIKILKENGHTNVINLLKALSAEVDELFKKNVFLRKIRVTSLALKHVGIKKKHVLLNLESTLDRWKKRDDLVQQLLTIVREHFEGEEFTCDTIDITLEDEGK